MPGSIRRRVPARPERATPHEAGQAATLPSGAVRQVDPASQAGASGAPTGGSVRASGRSPSVRAGLSRGATLAGVGLGIGAAISVPKLLGSGREGGLDDVLFGSPKQDRDGDGKPDPSPPGEALLNPAFLLLVAGAIAWAVFA
jgi:hypothetical protein